MVISVAVPMGFLCIIIILVGCLYLAHHICRSANAINGPSPPYGGFTGGGSVRGCDGDSDGGSDGGCDD